MASALLVSAPASAQDVLSRIEEEVAAIVRAARGAVVAIEDQPRALTLELGALQIGGLDARELQAQIDAAVREASAAAKDAQAASAQRNRDREKAREELLMRRQAIDVLREKTLELAEQRARQGIRRVMPPKAGTGFSIGGGHIVTTADVLEGMENPVVITDRGDRIRARIVGIDPELNVGILKLPEKADLPALAWGDSARALPGFFGITIGNQGGQMNSAALNMIAGIKSEGTFAGARFYPTLIQVVGTVAAGVSGAPLLNTRGEVIGMMAAAPSADWTGLPIPMRGDLPGPPPAVVAEPGPAPPAQIRVQKPEAPALPGAHSEALRVFGQPGPPQGVFTFTRPPVTSAGFAVPAGDLKPVVEAICAGKPLIRGYIGVTPADVEQFVSEGDIQRAVRTVRIVTATPGAPAHVAGIRDGDILLSLNGKPVLCSSDVRATAISLQPGDILIAEISRNGEPRKFEIKVGDRATFMRKPPAAAPLKKGWLRFPEPLREQEWCYLEEQGS